MQWDSHSLLFPRLFQTRTCHHAETALAFPVSTEPHVISEVALVSARHLVLATIDSALPVGLMCIGWLTRLSFPGPYSLLNKLLWHAGR